MVRQTAFRSFLQLFANRLELAPPRLTDFRVAQLQPFQRIEYNLRHNQSCIVLVGGGHDKPGGVGRAGCGEGMAPGLHPGVPALALGDVGAAEFPVFVGFVDACQQALALLFLRQVQKHLDDAGAVDV